MDRTSTREPRRPGPVPKDLAKQRVAEARATPPKVKKRGAAAPKTAVDKDVRKYRDTSNAARAALVDPDKPLTVQQAAFAKNWASGDTIANACLRAGYESESYGYVMARMPNVLRVYNREKALYEEACQMTRKKVMDMQLEAFQMAKLMAEPASMVSAAREIGRMCGYYEPVKHQISVDVKGEVTVRQLNSMTDADLLKLITGATSAPLQLTDAAQGTDHEDDQAPA